jgi:hypothetical protein
MKQIITLLLLATSLSKAFGVDGYKEFKFGSSKAEVRKLYNKTLSETKMNNISNQVTMLASDEFSFGESKTNIYFYFISDKLLRVGIQLPVTKIQGIMQSLKEKYGVPTSTSSPESFVSVDTKPNTTAFLKWDNDTVVLMITSGSDNTQEALLIYTDPNYEEELGKKQQKEIKDAI